MKKKLQKVFAMLLALSMVMSLMSVTAFAEGETNPAEPEPPAVEEEPVLNATVKLFNYDKDENENERGLGRYGYKFFHGSYYYDAEKKQPSATVDGKGDSGKYNVPFMTGALDDGYPQVYLPVVETEEIVTGTDDEGNPITETVKKVDSETGDYVLALDDDGKVQQSGNTASMKYLFSSPYATMTEGGGLFQQDDQGYWYYDSMLKSAYYNNGEFHLSDTIVRPGWQAATGSDIAKSNFLPFNDPADAVNGAFPQSVPVDLWFGLTVEFDFYMTEDGTVDGNPMIFDFHGDDDVFVYIDDQLVLDIGGTHASLSGSINFADGSVVDPTTTRETDPVTKSLSTIFAGDDDFDTETGTFKKYTKHTLKFFYMERGGNISYCRLKFNLPVVPAGAVSVKATTEGVLPVQAEDQDYTFQLLDKNGNPVPNKPYRLNDPTQDAATPLATDENGYFTLKAEDTAYFVSFDSTQLGEYTVREINVPGYFEKVQSKLNDNGFTNKSEVKFEVDTNKTNDIVFKNIAKVVDFSFLKTATDGETPLSGAEFSLVRTGDENGEADDIAFNAEATSKNGDKKGVVEFKDIPFGTYTLTEEVAPQDYEKDETTEWTVVVYYDEENGPMAKIGEFVSNESGRLVKTETVVVETTQQETTAETGDEGVPQPAEPQTQAKETAFVVTNKALNSLTITKTVVIDTSAYDDSVGNAKAPRELSFSARDFEFDVKNAAGETVRVGVKLSALSKVEEESTATRTVMRGTATVTDLPADTYTVVESKALTVQNSDYAWEVTYQDNDAELEDGATGAIGVTNTYTHVPNCFRVGVEKVWEDDNDRDGLRPDSLTVGLFIGDAADPIQTVVLNDENEWEYTFKYDSLENPGVPTVREIDDVEGYTVETTVVSENDTSKNIKLTNTHVPATWDLAVRKVWDDSAKGREANEVTVWLETGENAKVSGSERKLNAENNWYTVYENLFKYADGKAINYTVVEKSLGGNWSYSADETAKADFTALFTEVYTAETAEAYLKENTADWETMEAAAQQALIDAKVGTPVVDTTVFENVEDFVVVTNSYTPGGGGGNTVSVTKKWANDDPATRPESITVQLLWDGEVEKEAVLSAENNWKASWSVTKLGKWSVAEVDVPDGYTSEVKKAGNRFTITNTYDATVIEEETPPLTELPGGNPPLTEIPDDVPLADVPKTGDMSALWMTLSALSGAGLFLTRKKREDD